MADMLLLTCSHAKDVTFHLEAGMYKKLSDPQQAVLVLGKFHNRMVVEKIFEHLPFMKRIFLHPEIEQRHIYQQMGETLVMQGLGNILP